MGTPFTGSDAMTTATLTSHARRLRSASAIDTTTSSRTSTSVGGTAKKGLEYEGKHHRTDPFTFERGIAHSERLIQLG